MSKIKNLLLNDLKDEHISVVYKENTLGYAFNHRGCFLMGVLNSNKDGLNWVNGSIFLSDDDFKENLRLANKEDFKRLKVQDEGHLILT